MRKDSNVKVCVGILVSVLLMLTVAGIFILTPSTYAKYVISDEQEVSINVIPAATVLFSESEGADWLISEFTTDRPINTNDHTVKALFKKNLTKLTSSTLDSTGPNFGVYVCDSMLEELTGSSDNELFFSFCIYVTSKTEGDVKKYYCNVLFVNRYIGDMSAGDVVDDVHWFRDEITAGLNDKDTPFALAGNLTESVVSVTLNASLVERATDKEKVVVVKMNYPSGN